MTSTIQRISLTSTGHIEVELRKQPLSLESITEDSVGTHRLTIEPGGSVDVLSDLNLALAGMGIAPVTDDDWQRVRDIAAAAVRSGT